MGLRINRYCMKSIIIFTFTLSLMSCKTMIDQAGVCSIPGPQRVYGGTRFTFEMYLEKEDDQNSIILPMTLFNVIDLPLCIIADTLLLPQTLYWNLWYTKEERDKMIGEEYIRTRDEKRRKRKDLTKRST